MVKTALILGAGTAGLLAALTLRRRCPDLKLFIVRSPEIGVIGVGEGTTAFLPQFLVNVLGLDPVKIYEEAQPTWKLGIRFLWGPRGEFYYTFSHQFNGRHRDLPRSHGFYCDDSVLNVDLWSALMQHDRAVPRRPDGSPDFQGHQHLGFHIENAKFVRYLENRVVEAGVKIIDGTLESVRGDGGGGVAELILESGQHLSADLYIDASGFRSELLGRAFGEPFESFSDSLFCDRAIIGGWPRTNEPIKPYTTSETMDAGWAWQIEHEHYINRGYVFSSRHISDDEAQNEFLARNPKIQGDPRLVRFRSGRYRRSWVHNVVAIGNSCGFVEPLEATAIAAIAEQCRTLASCLVESGMEPTESIVDLYNNFCGGNWDEIRDFIALHYKFNSLKDTPFWRACMGDIDLKTVQPLVDFYRENGPISLHSTLLLKPLSSFGMEGHLAMLVGQKVRHRKEHRPTEAEMAAWKKHCSENASMACKACTVEEGLAAVRRLTGHQREAAQKPGSARS